MTELVSIGRYIKFEKGKAPKETFDFPAEGLVPYLSPEYLRGIGNPMYVVQNDKLVNINDGEIIILWDGSNAGEILNSKKGILASTMTKIIFDENEFDKIFFHYVLKYNEYILKAKTAGSGIPHVDKGIVKKLEVLKPSKPEQKIIASVLIKVDDLIFRTRLSIEKAERLRKSLMQNLLTGKLKPNGTWRKEDEFCLNKSDSISMKALQIFLNKLRPINWKFIGLKKIINLVYGSSLADYSETKGNYPVFGSNGIIGYTDNYLIKGPGIIVGRKGTIGAVNWTNENFYPIDTTYYVDIIDKEINLKWVYYILNFLNLPKLNSATGVPGLNKSDALSLYTIVPPIEEQLSIVSTLEQLESKIQSKENIITKLYRLKESLLQNLLTGKVKIKPN